MTEDRAYVSSSSASHDEVSVIDTVTRTVIASYSLAFSVTALAASPDGKRVYAARIGDNYVDVAVIDTTAERVGTIDIATGAGIGIDALKVDSSGKRLYVATTDAASSALAVVDIETARVERTVVGRFADPRHRLRRWHRLRPDVRPDRGGAVHVVDLSTAEITGTVDLGIGAPTQMTMSADATRAYIVDYNKVTVLCTLTLEIVDAVNIDARPSSVAVDSDSGRLYVADYAGGVTAFSVASAMPSLYSQIVATEPIPVPDCHGPGSRSRLRESVSYRLAG